MSDIDWYEIKFLESSSNLKELIKQSVGRQPSTKIANEIAVCVQQGRMFFEAAASSPLEIKPLQIFYGIVGFAKAVVLARNVTSIETLDQSHGISDISSQNARLHEINVKIQERGIFQQFNNVIAKIGCISYSVNFNIKKEMKYFDEANTFIGKKITLKEILARIPYLESLYERTFGESAKVVQVGFAYWNDYNGYVDIKIFDQEIFTGRESLKKIVHKCYIKYPFLKDWCLAEAFNTWDKSTLVFGNIAKKGIDEFSEEFLVENDGQFMAARSLKTNLTYERRNFTEIIQPMTGGFTNSHTHIIEPYKGLYISEFSLHFLGTFLLSSLVRYRPQIWRYAISRSFTHESPADDRALALIERYLDLSLREFPQMVVSALEFNSNT
jgi:uncharacterized protein YbcV (DUF1398 family)